MSSSPPLAEEGNSRQSFDCDNSQSLSQPSSKINDFQKMQEILEYEWPPDSGQDYFIEEYLAEYLEIKSMRRFYPAVERRRIQMLDEREYLLEKGFVNELQCDLGVIVIPADQVYKLIAQDHAEKFKIYIDALLQKNYEKTISESLNTKLLMTADELRIAAMKSCVSWNAKRNNSKPAQMKKLGASRQRRESYCSRDADKPKIGYFPLAIKSGQYVNYPRRFSSEFLLQYSLLMQENLEDGREMQLTEDPRSPSSECSTVNCETDSASSSSSTLTCSVSELAEFDSDFNSCDSF